MNFPFNDEAIIEYTQFKRYSFLEFKKVKQILEKIKSVIDENKIEEGYFTNRILILGNRGIGKTSTLFYIRDFLEVQGVKSFMLNRTFEIDDLRDFYQIDINNLEEPIYILVDIPDRLETKNIKSLFDAIWTVGMNKNGSKISFVFAINKTNFDKAETIGETFGKFNKFTLEKLNREETEELIRTRLNNAGLKIQTIFSEEIIDLIYEYTKGIPRNIISACSLIFNKGKVDINETKKTFKEDYSNKIIDDRIENEQEKLLLKNMLRILKDDFKCSAKSKENYIKLVQEQTGVGKNSIQRRITKLIDLGIFREYRGGENRLFKILTIED